MKAMARTSEVLMCSIGVGCAIVLFLWRLQSPLLEALIIAPKILRRLAQYGGKTGAKICGSIHIFTHLGSFHCHAASIVLLKGDA